ncbi:hypothetical protein [Chroococcidiopsis cubana]|uniref:hypothetical protein n=1 Tax=Chroococcidiopsis cubana TaxID=171392 RepID=UPI0013159B4D|nr:hypothetical protein [Chroococcidiopsis cubana]
MVCTTFDFQASNSNGDTIEVASDGEGCGATFIVKLPLVASAESNDNAQTL